MADETAGQRWNRFVQEARAREERSAEVEFRQSPGGSVWKLLAREPDGIRGECVLRGPEVWYYDVGFRISFKFEDWRSFPVVGIVENGAGEKSVVRLEAPITIEPSDLKFLIEWAEDGLRNFQPWAKTAERERLAELKKQIA